MSLTRENTMQNKLIIKIQQNINTFWLLQGGFFIISAAFFAMGQIRVPGYYLSTFFIWMYVGVLVSRSIYDTSKLRALRILICELIFIALVATLFTYLSCGKCDNITPYASAALTFLPALIVEALVSIIYLKYIEGLNLSDKSKSLYYVAPIAFLVITAFLIDYLL